MNAVSLQPLNPGDPTVPRKDGSSLYFMNQDLGVHLLESGNPERFNQFIRITRESRDDWKRKIAAYLDSLNNQVTAAVDNPVGAFPILRQFTEAAQWKLPEAILVLHRANLRRVNLSGQDLDQGGSIQFSGVNLSNCVLRNTRLPSFCRWTNFSNADVRGIAIDDDLDTATAPFRSAESLIGAKGVLQLHEDSKVNDGLNPSNKIQLKALARGSVFLLQTDKGTLLHAGKETATLNPSITLATMRAKYINAKPRSAPAYAALQSQAAILAVLYAAHYQYEQDNHMWPDIGGILTEAQSTINLNWVQALANARGAERVNVLTHVAGETKLFLETTQQFLDQIVIGHSLLVLKVAELSQAEPAQDPRMPPKPRTPAWHSILTAPAA